MNDQREKMSQILLEMSQRLLRNSAQPPSVAAANMTVFFANLAWNESVGLVHPRASYRNVWKNIESDDPQLWRELKSSDIDALIDELVTYKERHYPHDLRRILTCGIVDGKIRVEWLPPVAAGVDIKWETKLYGLVRTGNRPKAIRLLKQTRHLSAAQAKDEVERIASQLGMC